MVTDEGGSLSKQGSENQGFGDHFRILLFILMKWKPLKNFDQKNNVYYYLLYARIFTPLFHAVSITNLIM